MANIFKITYDEDDFNRALEKNKSRLDRLGVDWKNFKLVDYAFRDDNIREITTVDMYHDGLGYLEYSGAEYVGHIPDGLLPSERPSGHISKEDVLNILDEAEKKLDSFNRIRDSGVFEEIRSTLKSI